MCCQCPRRPGSRSPFRRRSGAPTRLQHGLSKGDAGGDRRLRSTVPGGRRRRRCRVADPEEGPDARVQPGSGRLAPPPQLGGRLLETAAGIRSGGGLAGTEVAGEVQPSRASHLGRSALRERPDGSTDLAARAHLPRYVGKSPVPIALSAGGRSARRPLADAGVVPPDCCPGRPFRAGNAVDAVILGYAPPDAGGRRTCGAGAHERGPSVRRCAAIPWRPSNVAHGAPPPASAARAPVRANAPRPHPLASATSRQLGVPPTSTLHHLERGLAGALRVAPFPGGPAPRGRCACPSGRRLRPLGPRGAGRYARVKPVAHGHRGARRRQTTRAVPFAATVLLRGGGSCPRICYPFHRGSI